MTTSVPNRLPAAKSSTAEKLLVAASALMIERSSIDFYATTRSLYRQNRAAQINGGKAPDENLPNF